MAELGDQPLGQTGPNRENADRIEGCNA